MFKYAHGGGISIFNNNNLDILPHLRELTGCTVNCILTDPPYGMDFQSNYREVKYKKIKNDACLDWLDEFSKLCFDIAANNSAHYIFCSFHSIDKFKQSFERYFKIKDILVWKKNNTGMGDLKGSFAPKHEFILFMQKGRRLINGTRDCNILEFSRTNNKFHPTEKPVDLCEYLLEKFTDIGDTVLDPFMGSGTTGVSCKNMGRNFIGIEEDDVYFETAYKRIFKGIS